MQYHVVTFHKAASNWTRRLFRDVAKHLNCNVWVNRVNPSRLNQPVDVGASDTFCIYMAGGKRAFDKKGQPGDPIILCVRDPKDVVVSQYFSWSKTHEINSKEILEAREVLSTLSARDGMMYLIENDKISMCRSLRDWAPVIQEGRTRFLRYEDLVSNFSGAMTECAQALGVELKQSYLAALEERYSFKSVTGRNPGSEDQSTHYRKGVAGDWRNHFDAEMVEAFNARYGDICDMIGYARAEVVDAPATAEAT